MDITGTQKVNAARQRVFDALLNPEVLKNCIPGCEKAEFVDFPSGRELKLVIAPSIPGFKGPYTVYLRTGEVVAPSRVVLIAEPTSSLGSVKAACTVDLVEEAAETAMSYAAHAELTGKIAATPEFVIKSAVKSALDQFFKNFNKQVSNVTA
ncbi:MAG: hypothetical protein H0W02_11520 [Ktedonobacteraceae bacterium]|nr:hypothetical protein [Ktedonobacteraceae bacterium]